jgi:hypothetical protein
VREQFCTDTRSQPTYAAGVGFFRCAEPTFPLRDPSSRHAPYICSMMVRRLFAGKGIVVATKERLAAMAASLCAVCSGLMVAKPVVPDPRDSALELRTYVCAECGHSRTYSIDAQ